MKAKIILGALFVFTLMSFVSAIEYNEIRLTNEEFEQGKTLEVTFYDKIIFSIDGQDYSVTIHNVGTTGFSRENEYIGAFGIVGIRVSENNQKDLSFIPADEYDPYRFYASKRKFEVNYDFRYDIEIELNEAPIEKFRNRTALITIKKIDEEIPEDVQLDYYCAKFYKCPNGERIRYTEMKGNGCANLGSPFSMCNSQYSNCYTARYTCENTGKSVRICDRVGVEGTLGYGCECLENPEEGCGDETPNEEVSLENTNQEQEIKECPEITPPNCPENSELEEEKDSNECVIGHKCIKKLSNGRNAEVKIMPEAASEKAIERLGELDFNIELKEVGEGDKTKPIYEFTGKKNGRFLGIFKIQARIQTQIDAETGEVIKIKKPWWSFLVTGI